MSTDRGLLEVLIQINAISNDKRLDFKQKLQQILAEIVKCLQVESGSIMLVKGPKNLEVAASTNEELIGKQQRLDEQAPSSWVVNNKDSLYIKDISKSDLFPQRFDHYKKSAMLLVPVMANDKVVGILTATNKIGVDHFQKDEQRALLTLAGQIISALENQRLTESLKRKKETLQKKNIQLKKLEKLKTDFYNMLIHDLKGPVSELIANLDILSYAVADEDKEFVEASKTACDTLYSMVFNLLDISQLEEDRLKLLYEKIIPQDLIQESLARLSGHFTLKDLTFVEKVPADSATNHFWGDRGILLRILQNLLTNAINYSPPGTTIEIGFEYLPSSEIKFFVQDQGPGVPPEFQQSIFDKYFQLDKKSDGRVHTTGLGLTFCKMAVNAHQGNIGVASEAGQGSCFFFILPIKSTAVR